ncbi:ORF6N domain-containing protein [Roseburia sp. TF10-5]|nr:ORF6N domain-containing protein [Roseburia sp. TF10-5]
MYELTDDETEYLRTNFSTANISSKSRYNPHVFTEQGLYMLMTVLKGPLAVKQSKALIRTLVHLKNSPTGVNIILFSDNVGNNKLHNIEYTDFCKEYPTVKLSMKKTGGIFHDRFIVLDYGTADERVFLCGASSKDAGARITSIVEDYGTAKYNSVVAGLLKNSPLVLPK